MHKVHFTEVGSKAEQWIPDIPVALDRKTSIVYALRDMTRQCITDLTIIFEQWRRGGQDVTVIPITILGKIVDRWMPGPHMSITFLTHCPILMERKVGYSGVGETTPYLTLRQVIREHMMSLLKEEWKAYAVQVLEERARGDREMRDLNIFESA